MDPHTDPAVAEIERAAFQLRRLWTKPELVRRMRACHGGDHPIQMSSLMVIYAVSRADEEGERDVTVGAVAGVLDIDPSTASRLVGHAIDAGFVIRTPSPVDARRVNLRLTDVGRHVNRAMDDVRRHYIGRIVSDWPDEDRAHFARLLRRFTESAARSDPSDAHRVVKVSGPADE